jgi:HEAT repeat protein
MAPLSFAKTSKESTGAPAESRGAAQMLSPSAPVQVARNPEPVAAMLADSDTGISKGALFDDGRQLSKIINRPTTSLATAVAAAMKDKNRPEYPRWMCCKVLGEIGDEQAVPDVVQVMLHDQSEVVRDVAADVVGQF